MPEAYFVRCACGGNVDVQLGQAGTEVECYQCLQMVSVPSISKLRSATDHFLPIIELTQSIERDQREKNFPFNGVCLCCHDTETAIKIPITLRNPAAEESPPSAQESEHSDGEEVFVAAPALDSEIRFPIYLCEGCFSDFQKSRRSYEAFFSGAIGILGVIMCLCANRIVPLAAAMVCGFIPLAFYFDRKAGEQSLRKRLDLIPAVRELLLRDKSFVIIQDRPETYHAAQAR